MSGKSKIVRLPTPDTDTSTAALRGAWNGPVDLGPVEAAPLEAWSQGHDIPAGTLRQLIAAGEGPATFVIGRRVFIAREDWSAWLEQMRKTGGARLSGRRWAETKR